ncbi:MAG: hypothetical protein CME63_11995 [Halobacteriovoraceae bacterium]|nr:hypothetical protein [Halobacteriovoraceae bacterium]|tara:strand:- start:1499 stop:2608 length:1110 start_codon:yes stop_codon:yes gene_type:complete
MAQSVESLYIHFPFCRHLCNYCDFYKKIPKSADDITPFEQSLKKALKKHKTLFGKEHEWGELKTLYIGGGTPSLWGKRGALYLKELLDSEGIQLAKDGEFTLEVNPGTWNEEGLSAWQEFGINRYSLGVQSLRADYLKILDRVHSMDDVFDTLEYFNKKGHNFSVDFMLGLPWSEQKSRNVQEELTEILKYDPNHLSLYILTAKGGYPYKDELPQDDYLETEFLKVSDRLRSEGYEHYEVSNFAKKGKASEHNLRYWRCENVAALGASAVGFLKGPNLRYKWKVDGENYAEERLSSDELLLERIYMGLRISDGINPSELFKEESKIEVQKLLYQWSDQELGHGDWEHFTLTSKGYLILDTLVHKLFPYF